MESKFVEIDTVGETFDLGEAGGQLKEGCSFGKMVEKVQVSPWV